MSRPIRKIGKWHDKKGEWYNKEEKKVKSFYHNKKEDTRIYIATSLGTDRIWHGHVADVHISACPHWFTPGGGKRL